jgi:hypothetical protein
MNPRGGWKLLRDRIARITQQVMEKVAERKRALKLAADLVAFLPFPVCHNRMCAASLIHSDKTAYKYLVGSVPGCR